MAIDLAVSYDFFHMHFIWSKSLVFFSIVTMYSLHVHRVRVNDDNRWQWCAIIAAWYLHFVNYIRSVSDLFCLTYDECDSVQRFWTFVFCKISNWNSSLFHTRLKTWDYGKRASSMKLHFCMHDSLSSVWIAGHRSIFMCYVYSHKITQCVANFAAQMYDTITIYHYRCLLNFFSTQNGQ